MMEKTLNLSTVTLKIDGRELAIDLTKLHETWLVRCVEYGARRLVNDTYSGEKGNEKFELCRAMIAEMQNGQAMPAKERKAPTGSKVDPVVKLARDLATTFLTQSLSAKLGKDMSVWAKNEKLAKLFTFTEKGNARFNLAEVDAWIKSYDKRDFMAEARELVNAAQQDDGDDLEELGF